MHSMNLHNLQNLNIDHHLLHNLMEDYFLWKNYKIDRYQFEVFVLWNTFDPRRKFPEGQFHNFQNMETKYLHNLDLLLQQMYNYLQMNLLLLDIDMDLL